MISYDFKVEPNEECLQLVQLAYENEVSSRTTIFKWFSEFRIVRFSVLDEEHTRKLLSAIVPENVPAI